MCQHVICIFVSRADRNLNSGSVCHGFPRTIVFPLFIFSAYLPFFGFEERQMDRSRMFESGLQLSRLH